mmetsp:Transcript_34736/g.109083  ORF Transcript_34736/g.109083 Transcript_34736/m.109083 type:complete len:218 (+) Transcript_34736:722-1375(+)
MVPTYGDGRFKVLQRRRKPRELHEHRPPVIVERVEQLRVERAQLLEVPRRHELIARQRAAGVAGEETLVRLLDAQLADGEHRLEAVVPRRVVGGVRGEHIVEHLERALRPAEVQQAHALDVLDVPPRAHGRLEGLELRDGLGVLPLVEVRPQLAEAVVRLRARRPPLHSEGQRSLVLVVGGRGPIHGRRGTPCHHGSCVVRGLMMKMCVVERDTERL